MRVIVDSLRDLRAHRVRSALAALSLFVAILAIVGVSIVGTLSREVFIAQDEQQNGRLWTIAAEFEYGTLTAERLTEIINELDRRVVATGGVYALQAELAATLTSVPPDHRVGTPLGESTEVGGVLVAGQLDRVRRLPILAGGWLPDDGRIFPGGLVLNQPAAAKLGGIGTLLQVAHGSIAGRPGHLLPYPQPVLGVVADGRAEPRFYQSLPAALHYQPALAQFPDKLTMELLVHYPAAPESATRTKVDEVAVALAVPQDTASVRLANTLAQFLANLRQTQRAFAAVAVVTLFVAVVGLLNIGLATLRERTRELSLRRALGATRARVFGLVLSTTLILSGLVAVVSVAVAYLGVQWWLPRQLDPASALEAPGFPWQPAVYGVVAAFVAGLAGGTPPALAAARVDVAHVLRE